MEPEKEEGNIEYKLKLLNVSQTRIEELTTQMRYRCQEGNSECIYNIGVEDDGTLSGITPEEYQETLEALSHAADKNSYVISLLNKTPIEADKNIYEVLVRENNKDSYVDIKVMMAGSVDAGKSSLLSVLTTGKNDDGKGSARLSVFNFPHEVKSGRTSSVSQHIMGYNIKGSVINQTEINKQTWSEIVRESSKIVSFFDLAGHKKYLKTTISGLSSTFADLCLVMVGANRGVLPMTKEHVFLCASLGIPFAIAITKLDMVKDKPKVLEGTMESVGKLLKLPGIKRIPVKINDDEDILTCAKNIRSESIVPIFKVSNVTGEGIENIKKFLNIIPCKMSGKSDKVLLIIDSVFSVPGVGTVVGGQLMSGKIKSGDTLYLGPNYGKYIPVVVRGIHCKKVPLQEVKSEKYVTLALRKIERNKIIKGNVLLSKNNPQICCKKFEAKISVIHAHSTTIRAGRYEPVVHCHAVKQSARLMYIKEKQNARKPKNIDDNLLRTGDKAIVVMEFIKRPEYITSGMKILLCEGNTKVVGKVL